MRSRLVNIILKTLVDEPKSRTTVTCKIKNYPKQDRDQAIREVMTDGLVTLFQLDNSPKGRKPVMIKLTTKGLIEASKASSTPSDNTIWSI